MQQSYGGDFASLKSTTKSILKNPEKNSSLAFSNSVLRKDATKMHMEGIGMNPNLAVEDEYIQNLIKQIHFMDLEIKLMKEKQQQDEALGGNHNFAKIGLKDGTPSADHIMTTTTKFKDMHVEMKNQKTIVEEELLQQRETNAILKAKIDNLKKKATNLTGAFNQFNLASSTTENNDYNKLAAEKKTREDNENEIYRINKAMEKIMDDNKRLRNVVDMKAIDTKLDDAKYAEHELKLDKDENDKNISFAQYKQQKIDLTVQIEKDEKLHTLMEENKILMKKCRDSERKLNEIQYEVLEKEELQKMSYRQKEHEIENRKKLQDELEKWKNQLEDTIKVNEAKVQAKLRSSESSELKVLQGNLGKEEKDLYLLNEKIIGLEKTEKEYIKTRFNNLTLRDSLKAQRDELTKMEADLEHALSELDPKFGELREKHDHLDTQLKEIAELKKKLLAKLHEVEEEHITLSTSYNHLGKNIKLEDDMKAFNMADLKAVQQTNKEVNEGIANFMQKWDTLQKFKQLN